MQHLLLFQVEMEYQQLVLVLLYQGEQQAMEWRQYQQQHPSLRRLPCLLFDGRRQGMLLCKVLDLDVVKHCVFHSDELYIV